MFMYSVLVKWLTIYILLKDSHKLTSESISYWLEIFVLEVQKESGELYSPNLRCGLQ